LPRILRFRRVPKIEAILSAVSRHRPSSQLRSNSLCDELRAKYTNHGVDLAKIEEVDYVWQGFSQFIGATKFDWIIASHVIEHVPCVISFLRDCESVLKPDGVLSLAIPDKRRCFDKLREKSSLAVRSYPVGRGSSVANHGPL